LCAYGASLVALVLVLLYCFSIGKWLYYAGRNSGKDDIFYIPQIKSILLLQGHANE
jgi:hypothetical protein